MLIAPLSCAIHMYMAYFDTDLASLIFVDKHFPIDSKNGVGENVKLMKSSRTSIGVMF